MDIPLTVLVFQVITLNDERDWRYGMRVKLLKKQVAKLIDPVRRLAGLLLQSHAGVGA